MAIMFVACKGKTACHENETRCLSCGRSLDEIYATRALVDALVNFAQTMGYQNSETFFDYVTAKASKKLQYLQQQAGAPLNEQHEYH